MKTTLLTRFYAFTLSAAFATFATVGVAVLMTGSGERAQLAAAQSATTLTQVQSAGAAEKI